MLDEISPNQIIKNIEELLKLGDKKINYNYPFHQHEQEHIANQIFKIYNLI